MFKISKVKSNFFIFIFAITSYLIAMKVTSIYGETRGLRPANQASDQSLKTTGNALEKTPGKSRITLGAGGALWGYDAGYITEIIAELKFYIPLENSLLNFDITLPMFLALVYEKDASQNEVFKGLHGYFRGFTSADYSGAIWPKKVSSVTYLITYVKSASWKTGNLLLAITPDTPRINPGLDNTVWYNPFFDANTGILNRYLQFEYSSSNAKAAFQSSSLTNPGLFLTYFRIFPFSNRYESNPVDIIKGWSITPLLWTDLGNTKNPDWGAGLETATGKIGNEYARVDISADGHFFSSSKVGPWVGQNGGSNAGTSIPGEPLSYRFDAGSSIQFQPFGLYAGYIYKSTHHPFGPYLSPLYPGRQQNDYLTYAKNHGILVRLLPGISDNNETPNQMLNFGIDTEIYPGSTTTVSLKGQMRIRWEKNSFDFAYIREDITGLSDFFANRSDNSAFIEFHLQYYLLPDTFLIEWRHVVSFYDYSSLKTRISLTAYF